MTRNSTRALICRAIARRFLTLFCAALSLAVLSARADAGLLVTNYFFNSVDLYNDQTGALIQSGFYTPPSGSTPVLGLTGIVVDPVTKHVYVAGNQSDLIYVFDGRTGG